MPRRWRRSDAAARGQNLPELGALLHLEMRDRAVAVPDLEVQLRVVLGTFGHVAGSSRSGLILDYWCAAASSGDLLQIALSEGKAVLKL